MQLYVDRSVRLLLKEDVITIGTGEYLTLQQSCLKLERTHGYIGFTGSSRTRCADI